MKQKPNLIREIIQSLSDVSRGSEKLAILRDNLNNDDLAQVFRYGLDPHKVYGIKKIPDYKPLKKKKGLLEFRSAIKLLDMLDSRIVTGNKAIIKLTIVLEALTDKQAEVLCMIIKGDFKCGVSTTTVNKVWPNLIPTFDVMKCIKSSASAWENMTYPCYVQNKEDGARSVMVVDENSIQLLSSSGKTIDIGHLFTDMVNVNPSMKTIYDGELRVIDKDNGGYLSRKKGNGIINKCIKKTASTDEMNNVVFICFDVAPYDDFLQGYWGYSTEYRYQFLARNLSKGSNQVVLVENHIAHSYDEVVDYFNNALSRGEEGVIVKSLTGMFQRKRVNHQIKLKAENTADLIITDIVEGDGKYMGKLGAFMLESSDGLLKVSCGSGFSDAQREEYYSQEMIGKVAETKYNEVISSENKETKSLFLPVFVTIRDDKQSPNALHELK